MVNQADVPGPFSRRHRRRSTPTLAASGTFTNNGTFTKSQVTTTTVGGPVTFQQRGGRWNLQRRDAGVERQEQRRMRDQRVGTVLEYEPVGTNTLELAPSRSVDDAPPVTGLDGDAAAGTLASMSAPCQR